MISALTLALLALLPHSTEGEVLAGALAFRALYYAVPAALAGLTLFWPLHPQPLIHAPTRHPAALHQRRAELGVLQQNGGKVVVLDQAIAAFWQTPQTLSMMFDPIAGCTSVVLPQLKRAAR